HGGSPREMLERPREDLLGATVAQLRRCVLQPRRREERARGRVAGARRHLADAVCATGRKPRCRSVSSTFSTLSPSVSRSVLTSTSGFVGGSYGSETPVKDVIAPAIALP